jgi:hypothetical protein
VDSAGIASRLNLHFWVLTACLPAQPPSPPSGTAVLIQEQPWDFLLLEANRTQSNLCARLRTCRWASDVTRRPEILCRRRRTARGRAARANFPHCRLSRLYYLLCSATHLPSRAAAGLRRGFVPQVGGVTTVETCVGAAA